MGTDYRHLSLLPNPPPRGLQHGNSKLKQPLLTSMLKRSEEVAPEQSGKESCQKPKVETEEGGEDHPKMPPDAILGGRVTAKPTNVRG